MGNKRNAASHRPIGVFDRRGLSVPSRLAVILSALCALATVRPAASQQPRKNVLVLSSTVKYSDEFLNAVEPAIRSRVPGQVTFYEAYLDDLRVNDESYRESEAETFRRRYSGLKIDLVIAINPPALYFADDFRDKIFPGAPIVCEGLSKRDLDRQTSWPGVTGVTTPMGFRETVDLALRLEPDTKNVAVVAGVTPWDSDFVGTLHSALIPYQGEVKEIDLVEAPSPDALQRVAALPPHTIVFFQELPQFSNQPGFGTWDLLREVGQRRPMYSVFTRLCIDGCIGGVFEDTNQLDVSTAAVASRVLLGERPENIPIVDGSPLHIQVDWRALRRWHIPESALPPGSIVLFRQPTLWEQGRKYFIAGIAVIVLQALLIFGLLWQRAWRKKTQAELRRSEEKFSKSFRHSPLAITIVRANDGRYVDVNETFEERTGWRRDEVIGRTPLEVGLWSDPNQRSKFLKEVFTEGSVRNLEVPYRRKDGELRVSLGSAELIEVGGVSCILSVIADITERKAANEALASLSGRLIEAQEAERTRIARELHDDISQRLALVAMTLKNLKHQVPPSDVDASGYIDDASKRISDLEDDVQALSHRLHSSKLEYLGLEAAAGSFCSEISERHDVKIDLRCDGVPGELSDDISLCLFRVLQEAVHNAVKYSGAGKFEVSLAAVPGDIKLRVHDAGAGFDTSTIDGHGLGLTSMRERLKLVNGELFIDSKPGHGTTILARVPLDSSPGSSGAAT
ncbi:MAG TPA: PAS domain S-box protein [Terracidiphilus sp.]|nr:PAS domain S-box protein [Terracidiphilus sp.]